MKLLNALALLSAAMLFPAVSGHAAVEISKKPTENMTCSSGVCTPTAKKAVLNVSDLASMLAKDDVSVRSNAQTQDVNIHAALSWTSAHRLTLDAYRSITFVKPLVVAGSGALTILTSHGGQDGDFRFLKKGHVEFWDLKSSLIVNGHSYVLVNKLKQLALDIRHNENGYYALAKSIHQKHHVYSASPIDHGFGGTFEGLGNAVSDLTISNNSADKIGLFSELNNFGVIRDIALISVNIDSGSAKSAGALVGYLLEGPTVKNSYATGQISGDGSFIGGLVGECVLSTIRNSHAAVAASGTDGAAAVGGLVGHLEGDFDGPIDQSYATGSVIGRNGVKVGGLVGYSFGGIITNSYATGAISGANNASVGGLIGTSADSDFHSNPVLTDSYSTGSVSGGSGATVGGLIGQDAADAENSNNYWDMDTSGINDPHQGAGNVRNDKGITGLTTEQFLAGLPKGFKNKVWSEKAPLNAGFPYLIDDPPPK